MNADIEIKCPRCSKKASFFASNNKRWTVLVPELKGKAICGNCGYSKEHLFNSKDYYYSIPINDRLLYARTFENLTMILNYFKENKRENSNPELDFPKEFYVNRLELIRRIEKRIENELKNN